MCRGWRGAWGRAVHVSKNFPPSLYESGNRMIATCWFCLLTLCTSYTAFYREITPYSIPAFGITIVCVDVNVFLEETPRPWSVRKKCVIQNP